MEILSVIWALINLALLLVLLRFWISGFALMAVRYGRWGTGAVFLLTLSMCIRPAASNSFVNQPTVRTHVDQASAAAIRASDSHAVTLLDLPFTAVHGYWTLDSQPGDSLNVSFHANPSGLMGYLRWETLAGSISITPNRYLHYESTGVLTWYLLGIPLYRQDRHFSGDAPLQAKAYRPNVQIRSLTVTKQI